MPTPNADPSCRATIDRAREVNALARDRSPLREAERSIEVTAQLRVYARFPVHRRADLTRHLGADSVASVCGPRDSVAECAMSWLDRHVSGEGNAR